MITTNEILMLLGFGIHLTGQWDLARIKVKSEGLNWSCGKFFNDGLPGWISSLLMAIAGMVYFSLNGELTPETSFMIGYMSKDMIERLYKRAAIK